MRRLVPILALGVLVAAVGVAWFLPTRHTRQPTEVAMLAPAAERQSVAAAGIAPATPLLAAEPPSPQLAVPETAAQPSPEAVPSRAQAPSNPTAETLASAASEAIDSASTSPAAAAPAPLAEPEMVSLPGGTFAMGSNLDRSEAPIH